MGKSAIYTANATNQAVIAGGTINLGNLVRRTGCDLALSGTYIETGPGYYSFDVNVNFTASGTATTFSVYKDGVVVPGSTVTLTTVADSEYSITIPVIVRTKCCTSEISVIAETAATIISIAVTGERI